MRIAAWSPMLSILLLVAGCTAFEVAVRGPQPATWGVAPGEQIGPDTTEFVAMVTERDCASGQSSKGRIVGPEIAYADDAVIIEFRVRPLGGAQACPDNPATRVQVRLDEPIGDRMLLDGGREPASEPPICANEEVCE